MGKISKQKDYCLEYGQLFRKGNILFNRETRFIHKIVKPKYFLILENYNKNKKDIIAGLLTSKLWRLKATKWEGIVVRGKKIKSSLILWSNLRFIKIQMGVFRDFEIYDYCLDFTRIYTSLRKSKTIGMETKERLLNEIIPYCVKKEEEKPHMFSEEQIFKIKKAFGFVNKS